MPNVNARGVEDDRCRAKLRVAVVAVDPAKFEALLATPGSPVGWPDPDAPEAVLKCQRSRGHHVDHGCTIGTTEGVQTLEWPRTVIANPSELDR